jgi:hypothetical protein
MIVQVAAGRTALLDPDDFRRFKVTLEAGATNNSLLRFEGAVVAWVDVEALVALSGRASDEAWMAGFCKMIEAARPHGWISADGREIRAHVEQA